MTTNKTTLTALLFTASVFFTTSCNCKRVITIDTPQMPVVRLFTDLNDMFLMEDINRRLSILTWDRSLYPLGDKKVSISEAAEFENQSVRGPSENQQELMKDIEDIVRRARNHFIQITGTSFTQTKHVKTFLQPLIKDWAQLTDRTDTVLLQWSKAKTDEDEHRLFHENIQTANDLVTFCKDLIGFMKSVMISCPVTYKKYLEEKENYEKEGGTD